MPVVLEVQIPQSSKQSLHSASITEVSATVPRAHSQLSPFNSAPVLQVVQTVQSLQLVQRVEWHRLQKSYSSAPQLAMHSAGPLHPRVPQDTAQASSVTPLSVWLKAVVEQVVDVSSPLQNYPA